MDYSSRDYTLYPGSDREALKVDFEALVLAASDLNVRVTFGAGGLKGPSGSYFSPSRRLIQIDTQTPNERGFVSLGQLSDEYLHAWNEVRGRGKFLDSSAGTEHTALGRFAATYGTKSLATSQNAVFHKLEALNFVCSGQPVPSFLWRVPYSDLRQFAYSWRQHF